MFTQRVRPEKEQGSRIKTIQLGRQKYNLRTENLVILILVVQSAHLFSSPPLFLPMLLLLPHRCRCATALTWFFVVSPTPDSDNIAPVGNTYPIT
jgi:hypothetical protein